jgi:hypothetical protein
MTSNTKYTQACHSPHINQLVDLPAVEPDLCPGPRRRQQVAHLDHGRDEVGSELRGAAAVLADQRVLRPAVEELLVRVQEPLPRHQVLVVGVVERVGGLHVERRQVGVAPRARARPPPQRREAAVDVALGVDAGAEELALRPPDGVRPRQRRHVARRQALVAEHGDEGREAGPRAREVGVRQALARRARVLAPQRHAPRRAAQLHARHHLV